MVELHTFSSFWWDIAELQHLRVLSIRVDRTADMVDAICQLRHLRELSMHLAPNERFITDYAVTMGNSLSHLESLIIVSAGSSEVTLMGTVIVEFRQLKTFLFIARLSRATEEQFRINLKPLRDRQVPINVFVNSRIRHLFTGDDGNVRLISMPNRRRGEALKFLRLYNCHGFDFNSQLCLKMMWSQVADGNWDLYSHEVEQADSSDVSSDPMDPYLVDVFGDSGEDEDIDSENSNEDEEEVG